MIQVIDYKLIKTVPLRSHAGRFGVEIEVEGEHLPEQVFGWEVHREGSLRGEAKEYVTKGPKSFEDLEDSLLILNQIVDAFGAVVHDSHRASVHIHVNVQEMTNRQIIGAVLAFAMVEPVFMRLCGDIRDGNLFCLPSYDCGDLPNWMNDVGAIFLAGGHWGMLRKRGKYSALNTDPLTKFGSLEFRTFPTSVETNRILKWAVWCDQVVKIGAEMKDFEQGITDFARNPLDVLRRVFGEDLDTLQGISLDQLVDIGAENAFESAMAFLGAFNLKQAA